MQIDALLPEEFDALVAMGQRLWPDSIREDFQHVVAADTQAVFLAHDDAGAPVGFVMVSLRTDHVEGTFSSPVGYVEGIYVEPAHRGAGIGRRLIAAAEDWSRGRGCTEIGSDTDLENTASQQFHEKWGFREVGRIVSFAKRLD